MTLYGAGGGGPGDGRDRRGSGGEIDLENRAGGVGLRKEDDAFAGVGPGEMAGTVQAAGDR